MPFFLYGQENTDKVSVIFAVSVVIVVSDALIMFEYIIIRLVFTQFTFGTYTMILFIIILTILFDLVNVFVSIALTAFFSLLVLLFV